MFAIHVYNFNEYMKLIQLVILTALLSTGCSIFRNSTQAVRITVNPPDAVLKINGGVVTNFASVQIPRNVRSFVECSKDGMPSQQQMIESYLNGTGFLDGIGLVLFLVPGIGLAAPGSHSIYPTEIHFDLTKPYVSPPSRFKANSPPKTQ